MIRKSSGLLGFVPTLLLLNSIITVSQPVSFTGNVNLDFCAFPVEEVNDQVFDVGMPHYAPEGTISGWDIGRMVFYLNLDEDVLQIGFDTIGIAGDVDGDGQDGNSAQWLIDNGGTDYQDLMSSESIGIALDFDRDGFYDIIAGVSAFDNTHQVCEFNGFSALPFLAFDEECPQHDGGRFYQPLLYSPDYELTLIGLDELLIWDESGDETCFDILAFGGSFEDDGIGEEYVTGTVCFSGFNPVDPPPLEVIVPDQLAFNAYPNPFNPSTTIEYSLDNATEVTLSVYNISGQLIDVILDGHMTAGEHTATWAPVNMPSGVYFIELRAGDQRDVMKVGYVK